MSDDAPKNGQAVAAGPRKKAEREQVVLVPSSYDRDAARVTAARTRALFAQIFVDGEATAAAAKPPIKR
jgi:hypothetical protein